MAYQKKNPAGTKSLQDAEMLQRDGESGIMGDQYAAQDLSLHDSDASSEERAKQIREERDVVEPGVRERKNFIDLR